MPKPTLKHELSRAAIRTTWQYLSFARLHPDSASILGIGAMVIGAERLASTMTTSAGLAPTTGGRMLVRLKDELHRLVDVPGDHSEAINALADELARMQGIARDPTTTAWL